MGDAASNAAESDYAAIEAWLFGLKPLGRRLGIDRMRLLADELGHPERTVPAIHVGGTNGKGSVAAMIESVLRAAGWRVGLYTSPHLVSVGERVQVDRTPLSRAELVGWVRELRPAMERVVARHGDDDRPSFFELMTAIAFLQFARRRCDVSVLEVGMGGEFDATNVVRPEVSVLTSVGLDHCEWLGNTVEEIARTKSGIIKPRCPVVLGRVPAGAEQVIREIAAARQARVLSVREEFGEDPARYPATRLEGEYQRWNAATASLAVRALGPAWRITPEVIHAGLEQVQWAGRWERRRIGGRMLVLDASHNPEGAEVLERNLRALQSETGRQPVIVVGVLGEARARPLLDVVSRHAREIHLVVPAEPRALDHAQLESLLPPERRAICRRATVAALFPRANVCTAGEAEDVVVVTGSIYLLGEVMRRLQAGT